MTTTTTTTTTTTGGQRRSGDPGVRLLGRTPQPQGLRCVRRTLPGSDMTVDGSPGDVISLYLRSLLAVATLFALCYVAASLTAVALLR